jgi:DNA-binding transcriptional LysR family regulator
MQDLNDLFYFAQVVERGSFTAASRALDIPKSKLSRRVAQLEARLGTRLLQRSTRRLAVTEIGQIYLRHCQAVVADADAAQAAIDRVQAEPQGLVRVSCPVLLAQDVIGPALPRFLAAYPKVRVQLDAVNRRVDVIEEGYDIALRVRRPPIEDGNLIIRHFARAGGLLVASPALFARLDRPQTPEDLRRFESLGMQLPLADQAWQLVGPDGALCRIPITPRLVTDDMITLRHCAVAGLGIVMLPDYFCRQQLAEGSLEPVLPDWTPIEAQLYAAFPSRRGLVPAVRLFIDFLAEVLLSRC